MSITRKHTSERMSKIVINNGIVYLCGQVAADSTANVQEQTRTTLARVEELLAEAGSSKEHILSATIYLRDIANHFGLMNEVWNAWVPTGHAPARACVQAHMASPALLVEISIVAAVAE